MFTYSSILTGKPCVFLNVLITIILKSVLANSDICVISGSASVEFNYLIISHFFCFFPCLVIFHCVLDIKGDML